MSPPTTATLHRWSELPEERVTDVLSRRLVTGQRLMVTHVYLKAGCVVPMHAHDNEQMSYLLSGALRFEIGGAEGSEVLVRGGEVLHIPPGVPHGAVALEDTLSVDIFDPPRQDWLDGTDDYLRR
jgi:quercetin dioxygenase-like cupin family protein